MDTQTMVKQEREGVMPSMQIIHATEGETTETFTVHHISATHLQHQSQVAIDNEQPVVVEQNVVTYHHQNQQPQQIIVNEQSTSPLPQQHVGGGGSGSSDADEQEFTVIPQQSRSSKTKAFYCPNCGNCYGAAGSLKLHIRACLKQKETEAKHMEARKCNICGKIYNSISYLKEHILRHSGKAPKKCPKCYRKFVDDEKLEAHIKSHEKEQETGESEDKKIIKEYSCSFCQKKFTVVFDSRYTKRRYACDECRDKFTNEENLKHHKESLEEKKDFHCDRCGRKFVFEGFLQRHLPTCDGTIKRKRDRVF